MRVLLFTGKGGVGKTTTAAATALRLADAGLRVAVTSADPAHSLADSFGVALGPRPTEVAPNCWAQEIDSRARLEESWGEIRAWLLEVFDWAGVDALEAEELSVVPGLDELFALTELDGLCSSGRYDVVLVDCAPTAETIRLLSLPDVLGWYMDKLFPVSRRVTRMVGPVVSRLTSVPVADEKVFTAGQRLYDRLDSVRRILADPAVTSVRLVVNPERMVVAEARRTYTNLSLFGYHVDAVVVNRVLPDEVADPWFARWRESQSEHLDSIVDDFAPLPVLQASLAQSEVVGVEALRVLGDELWDGTDPAARLVVGRPLRIERDGASFTLVVELPFADHDGLDVARSGDELVVAVGPHRRNLVLPESLRRREVVGASLEAGCLRVRFSS
ncbi:MAG: ArsA family ATPase [Actinomycetes bacterium]